jgi:hypothetical protein
MKTDLAAYQAAKAKVGHGADAHVKLALWCEAHGLTAERLRHLTLAVLWDPGNALARGLLGMVSYHGKWQRPDQLSREVGDDPARKALLREYLERRARTRDTADEQWKLALWCDQNGLKPQAMAHLHIVLKLDPTREPAWRRLGYRKQNGRWILPEVAAAEKAENEAQTRADRLWKPQLEKWLNALAGRDKGRRDEAERGLSQINDPRAVPSIWAVFARGDEARQQIAVRLLGQIDAPGSSRALALLGVFSPSPEIRRTATEILRRRDPRDFAGLLVGLIREPIKYKVKKVDGPGSQGELFVEGKDANVRRLYTPLAFPTLMPGDQLGVDEYGMPIARRILGTFETWSVETRRLPEGILANQVGADRVSQLLRAGGVPAALSAQIGSKIASGANGGSSAAGLPPLPSNMAYETSSLVTESLQIPIGQMILEARASAAVAANQLARDVQNIEVYNTPIREINDRSRAILKEFSGKDLGDKREPWAAWLVDLQGYAYSPQKTSASPPPTVIQQVPLAYQPQAVPMLSTSVTGQLVSVVRHSCFGAGTPVRTLAGPRPIEDIREGDQVLSQDTATGALSYQPVVVAYHNPPNATYRITLDGGTIVATGIHRFWKAGKGWVMARDLKPGDPLRSVGGVETVRSVEPDRTQPVYNLQLTGGNSFFVGTQGILAHDNSLVNPVEHPFDAPPAL